jgi:death on curing protein
VTEYLDLDDLLVIAREVVGADVVVRDYGLLESALGPPRATVFGEDAYADLHLKAAGLLQSLARIHALVSHASDDIWTGQARGRLAP